MLRKKEAHYTLFGNNFGPPLNIPILMRGKSLKRNDTKLPAQAQTCRFLTSSELADQRVPVDRQIINIAIFTLRLLLCQFQYKLFFVSSLSCVCMALLHFV